MKKQTLLTAATTLLLGSTLNAQAETLREHGAHVHGSGLLNIALDGKELDIQVITPAFDIVGFGHKAVSPADKKKHATAKAKLNDNAAMFTLPSAAKCTLQDVDIEQEWGEHAKEAMGHNGKKADHEDEKHDHDAKKEHHEGDHHDEKAKESGHSAFTITYSYNCATPQKLTNITTGYFNAFKNAKSLKASILADKGQKAATLTAQNPKVNF